MLLTKIIKTELQSYGVGIPDSGSDIEGRLGGAGPAEGITFTLNNSLMTVPVFSNYAERSPYRIYRENSSYHLYYMDNYIDRVDVMNNSLFNKGITSGGEGYGRIALIHGKDCLASTVIQSCVYWGKSGSCTFCGIGQSLKAGSTIGFKTPSQLVEVAVASLKKGVKHLLLTSGSTPGGRREINHLAECVKAIKSATDLPVQVQCIPPRDAGLLNLLKDSGVDTLGLHIESLDDEIMAKIAPAKASMGWPGYLSGWSKAVELFGRGQVTSYVIMGLGERLTHVYARLEKMANLGVYPYIVPLRPLPGTPAWDLLPPPPSLMTDLYEGALSVLSESKIYSKDIKAGCGKCTACSALPDYEENIMAAETVVCRPVTCGREMEEAMFIRRQIFVKEQGLFDGTDRDERDIDAVHLVARDGERVVGTVRLYHHGSEIWFGGRLAISPKHRQNGIGPLLVKTAVSKAKEIGALNFFAWVQHQNLKFFKELGWTEVGENKSICGHNHLLMQAF